MSQRTIPSRVSPAAKMTASTLPIIAWRAVLYAAGNVAWQLRQ
jgi:hypothetical protein